jgi:hypothetical protein
MEVKNVGSFDAGIRAMVGVALLAVSASFNDRPLLAVGAGFVALILLGTALFRMCPLYTLLGWNTCSQDAQPHGR